MNSIPSPDVTLIGSEVCDRCGRAHGLLMVRLRHIRASTDSDDVPECESCGEMVSRVPVWWSADLLPPDQGALLAFDRERRRLGLPTLEGTQWQ